LQARQLELLEKKASEQEVEYSRMEVRHGRLQEDREVPGEEAADSKTMREYKYVYLHVFTTCLLSVSFLC
jgi:hypothetical protein